MMAKTKKKSTVGKAVSRVAKVAKKNVLRPVGKALGLTGSKKSGGKKSTAKKAGGRKK
jgi:hypothetical protein